jgi:predicted metal-dependent peptidase
MSEVIGITGASGVSTGVPIIACDAEAYPAQQVRSRGDVERIELRGGDGTDMGAGIQAAAMTRPAPHIVVVFTDGYTPWPETKPRKVDSVIVVLSTAAKHAAVPDWCTTILLEE